MSFDSGRLFIDRGGYNNSPGPNTFCKHRYLSPESLFSVVETAGYFPPYLAADSQSVKSGDVLQIKQEDGLQKEYLISNVNPFSIATSTAPLVLTRNWEEALVANDAEFKFYVQGSQITLTCAAQDEPSSVTGVTGTNLAFPTYLWPAQDVFLTVPVTNNGTPQFGVAVLSSQTGLITVFADAALGNFTGTGQIAFSQLSFTYFTAA